MREKNTVVSDLMRRWNADIVEDLFLIPNKVLNNSEMRNSALYGREPSNLDVYKSNGPRSDVRDQSNIPLRGAKNHRDKGK